MLGDPEPAPLFGIRVWGYFQGQNAASWLSKRCEEDIEKHTAVLTIYTGHNFLHASPKVANKAYKSDKWKSCRLRSGKF